MYPNFMITGAPKCGTSSLHAYLGQHPEIFMSPVKETYFFIKDYNKGLDFYAQYFKNATTEKIIGESTATYCFLPFVADRIKTHFPDIKLIVCFRNPIERAFSSWLMQTGMGVEVLPFREAIDINIKQLQYVSLEGEEGEKRWMEATNNFKGDESRLRTYLQAGMYAQNLEMYWKRFKPEQIKYLFIDDFKTNLNGVLANVFEFLKVDSSFEISNTEAVNSHFNRNIRKILSKVIGVANARRIAVNMPKSFKQPLKKLLKSNPAQVPRITEEDKLFLWEFYKEDILKLQALTGRDLSKWNPLNN